MEVLKDISQLTKGCLVTFIKNDNFHVYEYLMVHPNHETYYLFIDNWTQYLHIREEEYLYIDLPFAQRMRLDQK